MLADPVKIQTDSRTKIKPVAKVRAKRQMVRYKPIDKRVQP